MAESTYFAPSVFINHGGGPNPVLGKESDFEIAEALKNMSNIVDLQRSEAIIVVTGHREEDNVVISSGDSHGLVYDYSNFPPESYKLEYKAPGSKKWAEKIHEALKNANIDSTLDNVRGWDHGVFIPMLLINPQANIPIIQVSILENQDSAQHYAIGKVLYQFRNMGITIFGSGMSYHNMKEFRRPDSDEIDQKIVNSEFDEFLNEVCTGVVERRLGILGWQNMPQALECHPLGKADHLMPLIVAAGAGGSKPGRRILNTVYKNRFLLSGFIWDEE